MKVCDTHSAMAWRFPCRDSPSGRVTSVGSTVLALSAEPVDVSTRRCASPTMWGCNRLPIAEDLRAEQAALQDGSMRMEIDVGGRCGTRYDETSAERVKSCSGQRDRLWDACAGSVHFEEPKSARGQLLPRAPGTPSNGRAGSRRRGPGSRRPRQLDPLGGRSGQGARTEQRVRERDPAPAERTRRACGRDLAAERRWCSTPGSTKQLACRPSVRGAAGQGLSLRPMSQFRLTKWVKAR